MGGGYDSVGTDRPPKTHAGAYQLHPGFALVAAADPNRETCKHFGTKWGVSSLFSDPAAMLARMDVDVLSIASSTSTHLEILETALASDVKVIFLEKPVADDLAAAKALRSRVETSGKVVLVNYGRRWNRNHILIKKWIDDGRMGKLVKATMHYCVGLVHTGTHGLDLMRWYFGDFRRALALQDVVTDGNDAIIDACFELTSGQRLYAFGHNRAHWNVWEMDLLLEKGRIRLARGGRILEFLTPDKDPDFSKLQTFVPRIFPQPNDWSNMLSNAVHSIYEVLLGNRAQVCTYADGFESQKAAEAAIISAISGCRWIDIQPSSIELGKR